MLAIPGEKVCREIVACGDDPYGGAADDAVFVDASAAPGGDGTRARPFQTIMDGVNAAKVGATVAIAAGQYREDVILDRSVHLRGRCPAKVQLKPATSPAALVVSEEGSVGGLEVVGGLVSVLATGVELRDLWVHDIDGPAITVNGAGLALHNVLLEDVRGDGVTGTRSVVTVEASAFRGVDSKEGARIFHFDAGEAHVELTVRRSVLERARHVLQVNGDAKILFEGSVFRDLLPVGAQPSYAIEAFSLTDATESDQRTLGLVGCWIKGPFDRGVAHVGYRALIDRTVFLGGRTASAGCALVGFDGRTTVVHSSFDGNVQCGAHIDGPARIEDTVFRDTVSTVDTGEQGFGLAVLKGPSEVRRVLAVRNQYAGVLAIGGTHLLEDILVAETTPQGDGKFGDGLVVMSLLRDKSTLEPATATVTGLVARGNTRAGLSVFGATATFATSALVCNGVDVNIERTLVGLFGEPGEHDADLKVGVGNVCGCPTANGACRALSSRLAPVPPPKL